MILNTIQDTLWYKDYLRTTDKFRNNGIKHFLKEIVFQHRTKYMIFFRLAQSTSSQIIKSICEYKLFRLSRKYGIEIKSQTDIGAGFLMTHAYNITISPLSKLGENVTITKGATIGVVNGKKYGAPVIGNNVYIGINSTIVGKITIGDDVLIASNTFVNCDIPSHSVVLESPCTIHHKNNAVIDYINPALNAAE